MMKNTVLLIVSFLLVIKFSAGQETGIKIYDPAADAKKDIDLAVHQAKSDSKHVLLIIGGNWCPWCMKLDRFLKQDQPLDSLLHADYEVVHVNYSKENKNLDLLKELGLPQRFGFPVIVILDKDGKRLHTQNTAYLETDQTYDRKKLEGFFTDWSVKALEPASYKEYQ
jgi:thioredoxin-related protein